MKTRFSFIFATLCLALTTACVRGLDVADPMDKAAVTATPAENQGASTIPPDSATPTAAPSVPGEIGRLELVGYLGGTQIRALSVLGDLTYAGVGRTMAVIRLTDPARPQRVGYVVLPNEVLDVAAVRSPLAGRVYAYVAIG